MEKVQDLMTTKITSCKPTDTIYEVSCMMKECDVGSIPVCDNGKLVGMITDRDIAIRAVAEKRAGSEEAGAIMSEGVCSVHPESNVSDVAEIMAEKQVRRLPVVLNGDLIGMVSLGDLATESEQSNKKAGKTLEEISKPA